MLLALIDTQIAGHPQSTVYALAEKIAADILGQNVPPPGYSMAGYYEQQTLIETHENSTMPPATEQQKRQTTSAASLVASRASVALLLAVSAVSFLFIGFL